MGGRGERRRGGVNGDGGCEGRCTQLQRQGGHLQLVDKSMTALWVGASTFVSTVAVDPSPPPLPPSSHGKPSLPPSTYHSYSFAILMLCPPPRSVPPGVAAPLPGAV